MTIQTSADIAGANKAVPLSAIVGSQPARRIWLCAHGSSNARFGDVNVAAARGVELPQDTLQTFSASDADATDGIDLVNAYVYVPSGTSVSVAWGN